MNLKRKTKKNTAIEKFKRNGKYNTKSIRVQQMKQSIARESEPRSNDSKNKK